MDMKTAKKITMLGLGIALYVTMASMMKIPLIGHIGTDLGYAVFGFYCAMFGVYGAIIGAVGCLLESLLFYGWVPFGWILGQLTIGLICGIAYKKINSKPVNVIITILAVFIGIAVVKTVIECILFGIPLEVKFAKNFIAFIADTVPMVAGFLIYGRITKMVTK